MLSIVISTFNELKHGVIQKSFPQLAQLKNAEIICVDFNSQDGTTDLIKQFGFKHINSMSNCRATRLNEGIKSAAGAIILLHHPRSIIEPEGLEFLIDNEDKIDYWGAFTHKFDYDHSILRFTSLWSNQIRGDLRGIYYLDHCIFAPNKMLASAGGVPEVEIFEDTLLCYKLKKLGHFKRLPYFSNTSAVRFRKNGVWKQALKNQWMKLNFYFHFDHNKMNKEYEKDLEFNSKYSEQEK